MKVAKQAVSYYHDVTGNPWSDFYDKLDTAMSEDLSVQDDEMWLIHSLMNEVIKHGMSLNEFKINKDAVKAVFDEDSRKQNGEFFTPEVWAVEARKYFDQYIPNWHDYNVWETSCYDISTKVLIRRKLDFKTSGEALKYLRDLLTIANVKRDDIDFITLENINDLDLSTFNFKEYLYPEGYTFIARISPALLEQDDEILTRHPETGKVEWCGYHNLFFKQSDKMIKFLFGSNVFFFKQYLRVTPDHQMYVRFSSDDKYISITAEELSERLHDKDCYIMLREGIEVKIDGAEVFDVKRDVWDLTTNNDSHCFCVSPVDGVDIFCGNCGSGNLVRSMGHNPEKLFMSTLQEDDVRMVQNTPEFAGANVFQCDFLSGIDYDEYNTQFLDKLPERLQQIIKNDEPLIIFSNPPYKTGMASATEVGRYMKESSTPEVDMSKPAYDMFYQFCWRYMKFVEMFNLTNCYCGFFGPLTFFTGAGANILLSEFEHYYDFVDGMCISAQEFSDTSDSIIWGIGFSLWKSTGSDYNSFNRKDILLEKKYLLPDGSVGSKGRVLYEPPREKLSDWVAPKDVNIDITAPLATSHLTFKGSEVFEKVAPKSGKMASNALGTLMIGNTLTRSADQSAILSVPSTIMYTSITEDNFW